MDHQQRLGKILGTDTAQALERRKLFAFGPLAGAAALAAGNRPLELQSPNMDAANVVIGQGANVDVTQSALDALAAGADNGWPIIFRGDVSISSALAIPNGVRSVILDSNATITQTAPNSSIFTRSGNFGPAIPITALCLAGERVVTVSDDTPFQVGSLIIVYSTSTVPGSNDKIGYMRRIVSRNGSGQLVLDLAVPRDIRPSARASARQLSLAPPFSISGVGTLRHALPDSLSSEAAIRLTLCESPTIRDISISGWGGSGVEVAHCLEGLTAANIADLPDGLDGSGFGYGVNLRGSTRGHKILGKIGRCRHAVTTNSGPNIAGLEYYGEPERNIMSPETFGTSDKALDTHRAGWGNIIIPRVTGSVGGGVQVRADNTFILNGWLTACSGIAIVVDSGVQVSATIHNVQISDVRFGTGVLLLGPARVSDLSVSRFGVGIDIRPGGSASTITNFNLDGHPGSTNTTGIRLDAANVTLAAGNIANVGTGLEETPTATNNAWHLMTYAAVPVQEVSAGYIHLKLDHQYVAVAQQVVAMTGLFSQVKLGNVGPNQQAGVQLSFAGPIFWRQSSNTIGSNGSYDAFMKNASDRSHGAFRSGDSRPRVSLGCDSVIRFGSGGAAPEDTSFGRVAPGVLAMGPKQVLRLGTATASERPAASAAGKGAMIYDSDANIPLFSDGQAWRDANGNPR